MRNLHLYVCFGDFDEEAEPLFSELDDTEEYFCNMQLFLCVFFLVGFDKKTEKRLPKMQLCLCILRG